MKKGLSEQQEMLLWKAARDNRGVVSIKLARGIYSSKSSAKSAVQKLELLDYIERTAPGYWKVSKLPSDIKEEIKHEKKAEA